MNIIYSSCYICKCIDLKTIITTNVLAMPWEIKLNSCLSDSLISRTINCSFSLNNNCTVLFETAVTLINVKDVLIVIFYTFSKC